MSTPETTTPAAPPPPAPVRLDDGVSLLSQAFEQAIVIGDVLLAANIGGGLARLQNLLRQVAVLELKLAVALPLGPPGAPAVPPEPPSEPAPEPAPAA